MPTMWSVDVQVLFRGETWADKEVILYVDWPESIPLITGGWSRFTAFADDEGHAEFEIEDTADALRDYTPVEIRIELNGDNYEFGPYELGDGAFTVDVDPD